jgi:hypothetical protein
MRRRVAATLVFCTLAVPVVRAQLSEEWKNWQYFRPITPEAVEPDLVRVTLAVEVYGLAQSSLADLRLIDEGGSEVPFVLYARVGQEERKWRRGELTNLGFTPGDYTQVIVDVGADGELHNALEIQTGINEFFAWVEVAASEDQEAWRIVRDKGPIYRFEDVNEGNTLISYPETRSRWLRLRILEEERRFPVYGCRIAYEIVEEPERVALPSVLGFDTQAPADESRWQVDLGVANVPASAVSFEAAQPEFHRAVRVQVSEDGDTWRSVGRGDIYRYLAPGEAENREPSSMRVPFSEARGRYWRVSVLNRNDAPVEGLGPTLEGTPRHVVFRPEPDQSYRLLYGNSRVSSPEYDLARLTPREELERAPSVDLGSEGRNVGYVSPEPWTEQHPAVMWLALGLAVIVLGFIAVRSLR